MNTAATANVKTAAGRGWGGQRGGGRGRGGGPGPVAGRGDRLLAASGTIAVAVDTAAAHHDQQKTWLVDQRLSVVRAHEPELLRVDLLIVDLYRHRDRTTTCASPPSTPPTPPCSTRSWSSAIAGRPRWSPRIGTDRVAGADGRPLLPSRAPTGAASARRPVGGPFSVADDTRASRRGRSGVEVAVEIRTEGRGGGGHRDLAPRSGGTSRACLGSLDADERS